MARWVGVAALGGGAGMTTWVASAGGFLLAVTWLLPVAAMVGAFCAVYLQFHCSRDDKTGGTVTARGSSSKDSPARSFAGFKFAPKFPGRALINSSKKLLISMKRGRREKEDEVKAHDRAAAMDEEDGGDFLWQRRILMGERCQPPDFAGVIIYDDKGNQLPEFPARSPKLNIFHPSLDQSDAVQQR